MCPPVEEERRGYNCASFTNFCFLILQNKNSAKEYLDAIKRVF